MPAGIVNWAFALTQIDSERFGGDIHADLVTVFEAIRNGLGGREYIDMADCDDRITNINQLI